MLSRPSAIVSSRSDPISPPSGNAQTTMPRDSKELLHTLIEDVTIKVTLRWKGGALNEIDLALPQLAASHRPDRRRAPDVTPPIATRTR